MCGFGNVVPRYMLAENVRFSGLGSAGQEFGVAFVEHEEMVVVEQVVEAKEWEEICTGASTPKEMHSSKVVAENRVEMNGWLVGHDMEM